MITPMLHKSMPVTDHGSDRQGDLSGTKAETFLPTITNSFTKNKENIHGNRTKKDVHSDKMKHTSSEALANPFNVGKSSVAVSETSSVLKLPGIGLTNSNSIASLPNHNLSRGRSRDRRSKLTRSPSCPTRLKHWHDEQEPNGTKTLDNVRMPSHVASSTSFFNHMEEENSGFKLPNIFQTRNSINSNLQPHSTNSDGQSSRKADPSYSFKSDSTFLNLTRTNLSPARFKSKLSPRQVSDNKSGPQMCPLLLPLSLGSNPRSDAKGKLKRQPMNGFIASSRNSNTEVLLREKLEVIEQAGSRTVSPPLQENEKSNFKAASRIDEPATHVSDRQLEDSLTANPTLFQSSSPHYETEKKVASVKG